MQHVGKLRKNVYLRCESKKNLRILSMERLNDGEKVIRDAHPSQPPLDLDRDPQFLSLLFPLGPHVLHKPILPGLCIDTLISQILQFFRRLYVADLLYISLCEYDIDFFERATGCFGVGEVDEREETGVDQGEEEVGAPMDVRDHYGGDHYDD